MTREDFIKGIEEHLDFWDYDVDDDGKDIIVEVTKPGTLGTIKEIYDAFCNIDGCNPDYVPVRYNNNHLTFIFFEEMFNN